MSIAYYDTYKYAKLLEQGDFPPQQIEALIEAQMVATESILSQFATRAEMQAEFQNLRHEIKKSEHRSEALSLKLALTIIIANVATVGIGISIIPLILQ